MAGVTPFNFNFGAGVYPIKYGQFAGECFEDFYYFDPAKPSNLTLDAPFTGVLTLLFSTFQGAQGLPSEFANETVTNAPIGAKDDSSLYDGTGNQITKTVTNLTQVIAANFDGVLWAYALDGVWYYVNQGALVPVVRAAYFFNGVNQYGLISNPEVSNIGDDYSVNVVFGGVTAQDQLLFGRQSTANMILLINTDGSLTLRDSQASAITTALGQIEFSGENTVSINRAGGTTTISINGSETVTASANGSFVWELLGARTNASDLLFTGYFRSVNVNGKEWLINNEGSQFQPSNPNGSTLTIVNHDPINWGEIHA